ncbi:hypothetical protein NE237_020128 [Protea cynaroides]|uniref:Polygalacturonase n=1 Tax=Protea cynaroides TaxID=273540 RepID=A0A9Q0H8H4_9MAGN|nr:hypothetical protein NE237_020128 [Protea cynaroides]
MKQLISKLKRIFFTITDHPHGDLLSLCFHDSPSQTAPLAVQSRPLNQLHHDDPTNNVFSLLNYGAAGDGFTDDTQFKRRENRSMLNYLCMFCKPFSSFELHHSNQAFNEAWNEVCSSSLPSPVLYVPPHKTFLLHPLVLKGPCNSSNIQIELLGNMVAPSDPSEWQCDYQEGTYTNCPSWLTFYHVNDLYITGGGNSTIDGRDSTWVYAYNLTIKAPKRSPNTDGIHISHSQNVFVYDSQIGTGDDCISIVDGSSYLNIDSISCGPGHGISIGSLGRGGDTVAVEYIHASSAVKISNVTYNQISGTSDRPTAIKFDCSETVPCTDIVVNDINIPSTRKGKKTSTYCQNVYGKIQGQVIPRCRVGMSCKEEKKIRGVKEEETAIDSSHNVYPIGLGYQVCNQIEGEKKKKMPIKKG